ncbi:IclR family transcriptional regulator [Streptomyces beihaiensis]|uniref:IclR family transcriptional regulator n=1 Tax=Streptomyces beihaiensis TaxID=2984495 RepID=A0ABT3TR22_9ACTN|nr:IclR family transcriptional regulator [Streptomyces beihaiensis]MCX3059447.1 IclR family transcriptional regulator [Streptomyces beihaiensis]
MTRRGAERPRAGTGSATDSGANSGAGSGPVLGRALRVLGAFSAEHRAMTLSELSRRAGLPTSTVHRMLGELTAWGALERGDDGRYRVGLRLWEVGALAPRGQGLRERALPYLEDLFQVTGENVQLAVREGCELVFVERIAGTGAVPVLTRVGGRFALTATGVGLVLLAHAPAHIQEQVLAGPLPRFTERTVTDPLTLSRMLGDVRHDGYAVSDRQVTMDAVSVAAPVHGPGSGSVTGTGHVTGPGPDGPVIAAVSLVVRRGTRPPHSLAPLVCTSARAISRALAGPAR